MVLMQVDKLLVDNRVKSVSLELVGGQVTGLIGPNGAGKSTLLRALAGVEKSTGRILLDGREVNDYPLHERGQRVGLLPQFMESAWSMSVRNVVALGRIPWGDNDSLAIDEAMHFTEVTGLADRPVNRLSGGERARVWLARVLAGQPRVLLVDEPVASLDLHYQVAIMDILRRYAAEQGRAVVVALHDLGLAARFCDVMTLLHKGEIVAAGVPTEVLEEGILEEVYGIPVEVDLIRNPPIVLPR